MTKKRSIMLIALVLALLMPVITVFATMASADTPTSTSTKYESPDINDLMGAGTEPEDISVTAGAVYQEKAWYEYVMYSEHAVASYRMDDDIRMVFYDPYTYTNSLIMDVQFDATTSEFDTMSSYTISHANSKTISACAESTYTNTTSTQSSGRDVTESKVENKGKTTTTYNHSNDVETSGTKEENTYYYYDQKDYSELTVTGQQASATKIETSVDGRLTMLGQKVDVAETITIGATEGRTWKTAWLQNYQTHETVYSPDYKTSTSTNGTDTVDYDTTSTTKGWTELSDRITKATGSSISTSHSWSETESTTVTKVYAATHFASDGVTPLPWAIVHYSVQMPMKCCLQARVSGEWVTVSTIYCLLTTVQGTCRAWIQNGQVYYEDWGNGEPVVATDFWSQFMTKDQLINAYKDKLYPVGGED